MNRCIFADYDSDKALGLLSNFSETVPKIRNHPDEFEWNFQHAQAFITSVQTTTGTFRLCKISIHSFIRENLTRVWRYCPQDHGWQALHHLLCYHQHPHIHVVHLPARRRFSPRLHEGHLHPPLMHLVRDEFISVSGMKFFMVRNWTTLIFALKPVSECHRGTRRDRCEGPSQPRRGHVSGGSLIFTTGDI